VISFAYYITALGLLWKYRLDRAGTLLLGGAITVIGVSTAVIPVLQDSPINVIATTVATVLFGRVVLTEKLFDPLTLANSNLSIANDNLQALNAITLDLIQHLDLDTLMQTLINRAAALLDTDNGYVYILDDDQEAMSLKAGLGVHTGMIGEKIAYGEGVVGRVWKEQDAFILDDYALWEGRIDVFSQLGIHAVIAVPLIGQDPTGNSQVVGVIGLLRLDQGHTFSQDELNTLMQFASLASIALENARLYNLAQQQREYFESLLTHSPTAIITIDDRNRIVSWNPAAEELFGYCSEEVHGQDVDNLIASAETLNQEATNYSQQVAQRKQVHAITRRNRKDGSLVDVELLAVPVKIGTNRMGAMAIYHDITELQQARQAAEAANEAKSSFLANMSHELRTPLNAIIGYSEMLIEESVELNEPLFTSDLEKIHSSARHLLTVINDILDLSKIEAGKLDLYLETFDIADMLEDIVTTTLPLIQAKHNKLETDYPPNPGQMYADLTRVRQCLFNLLSNAAKFTENGIIQLQVGKSQVEGHEAVTFRVRDSGIGMNQEQLDRLFQPFVQADSSTTRKFGGTGLGLTITRHFCQMMGGDIWVDSQPGEGSTFSIQLPLNVKTQHEDGPHQEKPSIPKISGTCKVLVIDDDPVVRDLLQRFLSAEGFGVICAKDGEQGIQLAQALNPAVITLDVLMPGMDGWSVLAALKASPKTAEIPIIMLTMTDQKNLGYALGVNEYLTKPIDRNRLLRAIKRFQTQAEGSILVVDDDVQMREMIKRILEKEGWQVHEAENGQDALQKITNESPQAIILDLMMPKMDGFQFIEALRKQAQHPPIPVLVLTAKTLNAEDRLRLNGYGENIIQKGTYNREALLNEVRKLLKMCVPSSSSK